MPSGPRLSKPPLVDRSHGLMTIARLVAGLERRESGLLVIEGVAGIGRSALLNHAIDLARQRGIRVLGGSGAAVEHAVAFGLGRQLFEPVLAGGAPEDRELLGNSLPLWLLDSSQRLADSEQRDSESLLEDFHRLFLLLGRLATEQPLLLALDDLHHADGLSLRWLAYLVRRLAGLPILVVATTRTVGSAGNPRALTEILNGRSCERLRLHPLSESAVGQMITQSLCQLTETEFQLACLSVTGGMPRLLTELLRSLDDADLTPTDTHADIVTEIGPPAIADYVTELIARQHPASLELLRAVAVLGAEARTPALAELLGISELVVTDVVTELTDLSLLRQGDVVGFAQPIVRTALYQRLSVNERWTLHRRAATLLFAHGGTPDKIAGHLLGTRPANNQWVIETLRRAADHVHCRSDPKRAIAYLRRAMQECSSPIERARLAVRLGSVAIRHSIPVAVDYLEQGYAALSQPADRAQAASRLSSALVLEGNVPHAVQVLKSTVEELKSVAPRLAEQIRAQLLVVALLHDQTAPEGIRQLDELTSEFDVAPCRVTEPADAHYRIRMHSLHAAAALRGGWQGVSRETTIAHAQRAVASGNLLNFMPVAYAYAVLPMIYADRFDIANCFLDDALDEASRLDETTSVLELTLLRAQILYRQGELQRAEELISTKLAGPRDLAVEPLLLHRLGLYTEVLIERGKFAEAASMLVKAGLKGRPSREWRNNHLLLARGRLQIARGDLDGGLGDLLECGRRLERWDARNPAVSGWRSHAALTMFALGDLHAARVLATEELELARRWGAPSALGISLRTASRVIEADQLDLLNESVQVLTDSGSQLECARSQVELGAALRCQQQQPRARAILRQALGAAQRCGATQLADRAHSELVRTGARPRRLAQFGEGALTRTEWRIARMAADGQTNREIASALFVSQRVIELHLTNSYRKLEIDGRAGLAKALRAREDTSDSD